MYISCNVSFFFNVFLTYIRHERQVLALHIRVTIETVQTGGFQSPRDVPLHSDAALLKLNMASVDGESLVADRVEYLRDVARSATCVWNSSTFNEKIVQMMALMYLNIK